MFHCGPLESPQLGKKSIHHHRGTPPLSVCRPTPRSQSNKKAVVYTIALGKQGKRVYTVYTIGLERRVYTVEPLTPPKKEEGFHGGGVFIECFRGGTQRGVQIYFIFVSCSKMSLFREKQGGVKLKEGENILPKNRFGHDTFPPPLFSRPVIFLGGSGLRPDESHFLRSPKLVLEGALESAFHPPPPQNRTIRLARPPL